jgi:hypothetical protein
VDDRLREGVGDVARVTLGPVLGVGVVEADRARVERVVMPDGGGSSLRANGVPVEPVDRFLAYLECLPRSPNAVVAYACDMRAFRFPRRGQGGAWTDVEMSTARTDPSGQYVDEFRPPASSS